MNAAGIRSEIVASLDLDLVGPGPGSPLEAEVLPIPPSRWYLTGFLVPHEGRDADETVQDTMDGQGQAGDDDETAPDRSSTRKAWFPSSMGLSVLVPASTRALDAVVEWGDYVPIDDDKVAEGAGTTARSVPWRREQRREAVEVPLEEGGAPRHVPVAGSRGLFLVVACRAVPDSALLKDGGLPEGVRSVSVFLVNERSPHPEALRDASYAFQARLALRMKDGFVARPDLRGAQAEDSDERVAHLQYRDSREHAVGLGVSATAVVRERECREVTTTWIPRAEVERVVAWEVPGAQLEMEALARAPSADELATMLRPLVDEHGRWIAEQRSGLDGLDPARRECAEQLLQSAGALRQRVADGIDTLKDDGVRRAFQLMNRAMAMAARRREAQFRDVPPQSVDAPQWRAFQAAFILLNLRGLVDPTHRDRENVDLLFFPTGGGKTEAYLGLAAFTLVLRRLRHPAVKGCGVSVLMRYTLRLLTLDQLGRAAALACALELLREEDVESLGKWPFEIGLWVGRAATPNRMGKRGERDDESARKKTIDHQNDSSRFPPPLPLENCPWCGWRLRPTSFELQPNPQAPEDLDVRCARRGCEFSGRRRLPIVAVDEPLYRRLPCFLIATVDKFANLPWTGESGVLFGHVERHDEKGFYGPCDPGRGRLLDGGLPPPDLIIQDELHLISGPLGTMVGLYETAIDALCSRRSDGQVIRPKVIASTATVRRAGAQIRALFARTSSSVFPPQGPDRRNSFFARSVPVTERAGRLHVGISAPGRSLKVVYLRTCLALLSAAQAEWDAAGGSPEQNPADAYMTLVSYFNSLRELGGSRRIVEDEVGSKLRAYGERRRLGGDETTRLAGRAIAYDVVELTSRENSSSVAQAKRRLALRFADKERVDVALATNMISVGLDIQRLGLMVVLGQPKTGSEYIQATSRVGRDSERPGLVVTLLNPYRPRDRSHYERFECWHESFYRSVEAVSVTPFSPRAVDRGLAELTVALARHLVRSLTPAAAAHDIGRHGGEADVVAEIVGARVGHAMSDLDDATLRSLRSTLVLRTKGLLDDWKVIAKDRTSLQYGTEVGGAPPLLRSPLDEELQRLLSRERKFTAHRSLRDVEPSVNLFVKRRDGTDLEGDAR